MSVEGRFYSYGVAAGADLSGLQYRVINVAGTAIAASNLAAGGVLQNRAQSGDDATLAYMGEMKAYAGGAISAGNPLVLTTSGTLQVGSQGIVGKALATATSGSLVQFIGNFATAF